MVDGLWFMVWGVGFEAYGAWCMVFGLGFGVWGLRSGV